MRISGSVPSEHLVFFNHPVHWRNCSWIFCHGINLQNPTEICGFQWHNFHQLHPTKTTKNLPSFCPLKKRVAQKYVTAKYEIRPNPPCFPGAACEQLHPTRSLKPRGCEDDALSANIGFEAEVTCRWIRWRRSVAFFSRTSPLIWKEIQWTIPDKTSLAAHLEP